MKKYTSVESITIRHFRGLKDVTIDFGNRITLICGKNGTSKSTILGIIAQMFSFSTDYSTKPVKRNGLRVHKTLFDKPFESYFSEHFRLSEVFDLPGSMDVDIRLYDGIEQKEKNNLSLRLYDSQDRSKSRPVLRGNNDRNITNPVIYLSLNRLTPIVSREYDLSKNEYIDNNNDMALLLTNRILLQSNSYIDVTDGAMSSLAPHTINYDYQSISVGEDNVGQFVRALLSFKRLKEEYPNYSGGVLLIDEVDAGLFPAAQIEFFRVLTKFCREYNIQVIMTSHSPTMIEEVYNQKDTLNYKINYLTNTFGKMQVMPDYSWTDIDADIHARTKNVDKELALKLPKINIYCEDIEARAFFKTLIRKKKLTRIIEISKTSLGGDQMKSLAKEKIPEFYNRSVIILDADKENKGQNNFCILPGGLPPDQLLYDYMRQIPEDSKFWKNKIGFTKPVFLRIARDILDTIHQSDNSIPLQTSIKRFKDTNKNKDDIVREKFKKFYKTKEIQNLLDMGIKENPFTCWSVDNSNLVKIFESDFINAIKYVLINGHRVPRSLVEEYFKEI